MGNFNKNTTSPLLLKREPWYEFNVTLLSIYNLWNLSFETRMIHFFKKYYKKDLCNYKKNFSPVFVNRIVKWLLQKTHPRKQFPGGFRARTSATHKEFFWLYFYQKFLQINP